MSNQSSFEIVVLSYFSSDYVGVPYYYGKLPDGFFNGLFLPIVPTLLVRLWPFVGESMFCAEFENAEALLELGGVSEVSIP